MEKIKIELTVDEIQKIMRALGKMPFEEVFQLISNISNQVGNNKEDKQNGNV